MTQASTPIRKVDVAVCKVDHKLGLVFGYAIVCKVDGEDYYDTGTKDPDDDVVYSDHITEEAMLEGVTDFMKSSRVAAEMHERTLDADGEEVPVKKGVVVHSFPLTTEIAKALEIDAKMTGWLVAMQPDAAMLKKFESGELKGFSIGGRCARQKEAA